jgi:hypothetical protein
VAIYEVSGRTTITTGTVPFAVAALRAVTRFVRVWECHVFYQTAPTTSGDLGLCYSTALGTGTLTSVTPVARSTRATAPTALLVTAWGTAAPTNGGTGTILKRLATTNSIGNGVIWTFDREPLEIVGSAGATSELCVVSTLTQTTAGTAELTFILEE